MSGRLLPLLGMALAKILVFNSLCQLQLLRKKTSSAQQSNLCSLNFHPLRNFLFRWFQTKTPAFSRAVGWVCAQVHKTNSSDSHTGNLEFCFWLCNGGATTEHDPTHIKQSNANQHDTNQTRTNQTQNQEPLTPTLYLSSYPSSFWFSVWTIQKKSKHLQSKTLSCGG